MAITAKELRQLRSASFVGTTTLLKSYWSLLLQRELTDEEVRDGLRRIFEEE